MSAVRRDAWEPGLPGTMDDVLTELGGAESVGELLRAACRALSGRTACDVVACAWTTHDTPAVAVASDRPLSLRVAADLALDLGQRLAAGISVAGALADGEGVACYVLHDREPLVHADPMLTLDFPLRVGGLATGVIRVASTTSEIMSEADQAFAGALAAMLAPHLEALRLRGDAGVAPMHDPLTGVYTAAVFNSTIEREIARSERHPSEFSVMLVDLHRMEADPVAGGSLDPRDLASMAQVMQVTLRRSDVVARLGPARFGVFMPETGPRNALIAADRIQQRLRATDGLGDRLIARMGISGWAISGSPREEMYSQAETAVQQASIAGSDGAFLAM